MSAKVDTNAAFAKVKSLILADAKKTGILPSLTAAQMMLESGWLASGLTVKSNNAFGIKGTYNGAYIWYPTTEWDGSKYVSVMGKFKKYPSLSESIADHSAFLSKARYKAVKAASDYKTACKAVAAAGYATAPNYANQLIQLIEQYKLYEWDAEVKAANTTKTTTTTTNTISKGDTVQFAGGYHYASSTAASQTGGKRTAGKAKVTALATGAKHPYHLIGTAGGSNVYGWVDADKVTK
jgi:hypothetical protein